MSLTKRMLEAEEDDFNEEIRLCAGCGETALGTGRLGAKSWRYEHSIVGPFTTIWVCVDCRAKPKRKCVACDETAPLRGFPICRQCLESYEESIASTVHRGRCERCAVTIPRGEWEEFLDSGLCSWCAHMRGRLFSEDRSEVEKDSTPEWTPEADLEVVEHRLITPEMFRGADVELVVDPALIRYLDTHPEEMRDLSPRQFEELVAELLARFGYRTRLGPRGRDGGVDVFAEKDLDFGPELVLVQCKRFAEDNKVGEPVIKQLSADVEDRRATKGLVVTTSSFTSTALQYIKRSQYRLSGADFAKLKGWIQKVRGSDN